MKEYLGFVVFNDGPIDIDPAEVELSKDKKYDALAILKPVATVFGAYMPGADVPYEYKAICNAVQCVINYIEHNRIGGNLAVTFFKERATSGYGFNIVCRVYKNFQILFNFADTIKDTNMKKINYLQGDATVPQISDALESAIITHVCNDVGAWGAGFVIALSKKWQSPEAEYRRWAQANDGTFVLGAVQLVRVQDNPAIEVANMIAQHKIGFDTQGNPPIRYEALKDALDKVAHRAKLINASVHMPRIGCGLAGGEWLKVEKIVIDTLVKAGVEVYVYDLPAKPHANVLFARPLSI